MVMLGFGSGGVLTGKITDRYGIVAAIGFGIGILGLGYIGAGMSSSIWQFILVHFAIGLGSSATFGPLMAEASHWFERYRGLAVAIAASGNYIGGTIWPPLVNLRHPVGRLAHHPYRDRHLHRGRDDAGAGRAADADGGGGRGAAMSMRRRRASTCGFRPTR